MPFEKIVGIIAGLLTSVSMLPQFFKLIKTRDSKNVSLGMLIVLLIGVTGWTYYGVLKKDAIITVTNGFAVLINVLTIIISLKLRRSGKR
jgi:MtN3 and saliva related transmembrane protein